MTAGLLAATSRGTGDESPLRIADLPSWQEAIALLESHNVELIRKHFGNPSGLSDEAYMEVLREALRREHAIRPAWEAAGPADYDPTAIAEGLLAHMDFSRGAQEERDWFWKRYRWLRAHHPRHSWSVRRELGRRSRP